MKVEQLNDFFRTFFKNLIDDGFRKRQICVLTLGSQSEPQFENFLSGKDFGIKPLSRLVSSFNYDVELILVPKDNPEIKQAIRELNETHLKQCKNLIIQALNNYKPKKSIIIREDVLDQFIQDLVEQSK